MGVRRATTVVIALSTLAMMPAGAAGAPTRLTGFTAYDQRLLADLNAARADRQLPPLQLNGNLEPLASKWAQHMADADHLSDNPHLGRAMNAACPGWRFVGEAVGVAGGASADELFNTYMRDSERRQTLMSRRFKAVGVSTVDTDEDGSTVHWNAIELADHCS